MKIFKGNVISTKMKKTATVQVDRIVVHPKYRKRYKRSKKYHVHDSFGVNVGDAVIFIASKPYSKLKRWKIIEIVKNDKKVKRKEKSGKS